MGPGMFLVWQAAGPSVALTLARDAVPSTVDEAAVQAALRQAERVTFEVAVSPKETAAASEQVRDPERQQLTRQLTDWYAQNSTSKKETRKGMVSRLYSKLQ